MSPGLEKSFGLEFINVRIEKIFDELRDEFPFIRVQAVNVFRRLRFGVIIESQIPIQIIAEFFLPVSFALLIIVVFS